MIAFFRELINYYKKGNLGKQLLQGGAGSLSIQIFSQVIVLVFGILLARMLGPSDYGIYSFAFSLLTVFLVPAQLGIPTLLVREVSFNESLGDWSMLKGILIRASQSVLCLSLVVILLSVLGFWIFRSRIPSSQYSALLMILIVLPFLAFANAITASLRGLQHVVKALMVSKIFRPALVLILLVIFFVVLKVHESPQVVIIFQLVAVLLWLSLASFLLYKYVPAQTWTVEPSFETKKWMSSAFSLALIAGSVIIYNKTDILMLGMLTSSSDVGVYSVATKGAALVTLGMHAVEVVIAPQFSRLYAKNQMVKLQRLVTLSSRIVFLLALPAAIVFVFFGGGIVGWVFGKEYARSDLTLAILSFGQLINAGMGVVGFLLIMTGFEKYSAKVTIGAVLLNIFLNFFLIPIFNIAGAAIATSVSLVLWRYLLKRAVRKKIGINATILAVP